ncbi:MAG: 5-formyltetrahydrofolate cyclo-ligase, partial [Pseudonocardiaceae bacterium]
HELQVVNEELPEDDHDFRVDLIVTPERVIECGPAKRPSGLSWDSLTRDMIAAIPVLAQMSRVRE